MARKITQASEGIAALDGVEAVAALLGCHYNVVDNWRRGRGFPPESRDLLGSMLIARGHRFDPELFKQYVPNDPRFKRGKAKALKNGG